MDIIIRQAKLPGYDSLQDVAIENGLIQRIAPHIDGQASRVIEAGGKEPSPAYLKQLVDECREAGVRVIFVQPEFDRRNAELLARQTGAQIIDINPLSYNWQQEMLHVARSLAGKEE